MQNKLNIKEEADRLWDSCIHSCIGCFTLIQEKRSIKLIEQRLKEILRRQVDKPANNGNKVSISIKQHNLILKKKDNEIFELQNANSRWSDLLNEKLQEQAKEILEFFRRRSRINIKDLEDYAERYLENGRK